MWVCYLLRCLEKNHGNLTYNGSTNNIIKRLRQHNGEIIGGARATKGKKWEIYMILTGFQTKTEALCCEWRIKHPTGTRRRPSKFCGVLGRISSLNFILNLDKWTEKGVKNPKAEYHLYVTNDVLPALDIDNIPNNVRVFKTSQMDLSFLARFSPGKKVRS